MSKSTSSVPHKGFNYGMMKHPWLQRKEDIVKDSPSRRDGMTYEEEVQRKQEGCDFLRKSIKHVCARENETQMTNEAVIIFHRFFHVHSLKKCNVFDIASACALLTCKNKPKQRVLTGVAQRLYRKKYPNRFPSPQQMDDLQEMVKYLEEVVLKTIGFDLNIELPHQFILKLMNIIDKGSKKNEKITNMAYFFATNLLVITDWSVRYSPAFIGSACVMLAAIFYETRIDNILPTEISDNWYRLYDESMPRRELDKMVKEILELEKLPLKYLLTIDEHSKTKQTAGSVPQMDAFDRFERKRTKLAQEFLPSRPKIPSGIKTEKSKNQKEEIDKKAMEQKRSEAKRHQNHGQSSSSFSTDNKLDRHYQKTNGESHSMKRHTKPEENNGMKKIRADYMTSFVPPSSSTTNAPKK